MKREYKCEKCGNLFLWEFTSYFHTLKCPKCRLEKFNSYNRSKSKKYGNKKWQDLSE